MARGASVTSTWGGVRYLDTRKPGIPLVLLHGLGNSLKFWKPLLSRIGTRRIIAVDIPGYGQSLPPTHTDAESLIRPVHALLGHLSAYPCVLVGHSLGGIVALRHAMLEPRTVTKVVLLDGHLFSASDLLAGRTSPFKDAPLALAVAAQFVGDLIPMRGMIPRLVSSTSWARQAFLWPFVDNPRQLDPTLVREVLSGNAGGSTALAALKLARTYDLRRTAANVRCPVDMLWGRNDRLLRTIDSAVATANLDGRRQLCVEKAGHWAHLERPEIVAPFIKAS
jgi:pimeloyl-ACP methyl ester carboxylesterase